MLTKEQINFLLTMIQQVSIPGTVLDLAYSTKQALIAMATEPEKFNEIP